MNKFVVLMILSMSILGVSYAQSAYFESEGDVITYMDGKTFYNADYGMEIEYGYISAYNTYGISVTNKNGAQFNFINVDITTYGSFADLSGMSLDNGGNFGFRLYSGKLIVGRGEPEEQTFYLK
jgi:hypothetical protein